MKNLYFLLLFASLQGFGQDFAKQITLTTEKNSTANSWQGYEIAVKKNGIYEPGFLNNIPSPVIQAFLKEYVDAVNVSWFIDEKQSTVYFNWSNELVIIKYNNNGSPINTRKTYTVEKLDRPFTDLLKREIGTKHDINYITEYLRDDMQVYEVSMSNDKEWVVVRLNRDKPTGSLVITGKQTFHQ